MAQAFILRHKQTSLYSSCLAALLVLLKWLEWKFIISGNAFEIYAGIIALLFTCLGIWLATKLTEPKIETRIIEKEIYTPYPQGPDAGTGGINDAGLSRRELEVLQLMAEGLSNQDIAGRLFLSLSTIKTHCSRIFEKLDAKRRTQAVEKAKRLKIIR